MRSKVVTILKIYLILWSVLPAESMSTSAVDFVSPIKSLLNLLQIPVRIQVMTCWKLDVRLEFYRRFNQLDGQNGNRNYQVSITDANIVHFPNVLEEHQYLIIVDLNCNETQAFLSEVGKRLTRRFRWITLDCDSQLETEADDIVLKTFAGLRVLPDNEVYCLIKVDDHTGVLIKQIYRTSIQHSILLELFGFWLNNTITDYRNSSITSRRRQNLYGLVLRASLVLTNNDSINHLTDGSDKHIDAISKVNYVLTNHLGDFVGGHIEYSFVNSWGYLDNNSRWSGMIGDLVDNRSDIGASALFFTSDRVMFIEYIAMPTPTRSKFVFRSPKLSYTENVFLLPFDEFVWSSVIGFILVTSAALMISTITEYKLRDDNESVKDPGVLQPSALDALILVFGATCQQGSSVSPRSLTSRIVMFIVFLMLMFLYTSYSANIVALLQSPSNKIRTLNDLLNSRLGLGADDTVFNRYYFTHTSDPVRKQIYERKILNKNGSQNFMSLEKGVEQLREGLFAFHMEIGVGYQVVSETFFEDEKCGLQEIQYLQVIDPWYAIQKNSSYKELLKIGMMRIHEHGLQERQNSKLYTKKPKCTGVGGGGFITASLVDTRPAILTLIWGSLFAIVAVFLEIIVFRKVDKFKSNHEANTI